MRGAQGPNAIAPNRASRTGDRRNARRSSSARHASPCGCPSARITIVPPFTSNPALTRYELCEPVPPRKWGLKAIGALVLSVLTQDPTTYSGGLRWRVRDRETGDYVYEVTTSVGGLDTQEARSSIARDLASMTVPEFEKEYGIDRRWDR